LLSCDLTVPEYLAEKSGSDRLTPVHRHHRTPAIGMAKKMVATLPTDYLKARFPESADEVPASDGRKASHAETATR